VALSDAWQKGAQQLTLVERTKLANDSLELLAVDGAINLQRVMAMRQRGYRRTSHFAVSMSLGKLRLNKSTSLWLLRRT